LNKKKIFNDPLYGFVSISSELIFDIIQHPYFQRLRRIKQLGLTDFIYPGANHTRFHHALGAMHLMSMAIESLKEKGNTISEEEKEAALIAILLHDIGHGPFSHALEHTFIQDCRHEQISLLIMKKLNNHFNGKLDLAIKIFTNKYKRKFFYQLVSSQLDVDRLDYLNRDCFFTGVTEGSVAVDRIIKMMNVKNDELVIEEKGIYSIENFLISRRLMYWQVYLHKTAISAESMLVKIIERAKYLLKNGSALWCPPHIQYLLTSNYTFNQFEKSEKAINAFSKLDDYDIWAVIKVWAESDDKILALLSGWFINRTLFKCELGTKKHLQSNINEIKNKLSKTLNISLEEVEYFVINGKISNNAYLANNSIKILFNDKSVKDVSEATDIPNIKALMQEVNKYYLCFPKNNA
jgi:uncharacterized protein